MKARNIAIVIAVVASVSTGSVYAAYHYASRGRTVNVVAVSSVNQDFWDMGDDTKYGEIISRNIQQVTLDTTYSLAEVYVKEGDTVKVGDPLLRYDMTMVELQRELEDLNGQLLELQLQQSQQSIDKLLSQYGSARSIYDKILQEESQLREEMETISLAPETMTELSEEDIEAAEASNEGTDSGTGQSAADAEEGSDGADDTARADTAADTDQGASSAPVAVLDSSETMVKTASEDGLIEDEEGTVSSDSGSSSDSGDSSALIVDEGGNDVPSEGQGGDDTPLQPGTGDVVHIGESESEDITPDPGTESNQGGGAISGDDGNLIADDSQAAQTDPGNASQISAEDLSQLESEGADLAEYDEAIIANVSRFLSLESVIRAAYTEDSRSMDYNDISSALTLFQNNLTQVPSAGNGTLASFTDVLGERRQVSLYLLNPAVLSSLEGLESATSSGFSAVSAAISLYRAYANVLYFNLVYQMNALEGAMSALSADAQSLTTEQALALKGYIDHALDAYYLFVRNWSMIRTLLPQSYEVREEVIRTIDEGYNQVLRTYIGQNLTLEDDTDGTLSMAAARLRSGQVIEETETSSEITSESESGDYPDDYDSGNGEDSDDMDAADLEQSLRESRLSLLEIQLQIRESDLKLKAFDRTLEGETVTSQMNGVVKSAGTVEEQTTDEAFITIAGEQGMYLRGNIGELELSTMSLGGEISGTDQNGYSFSAVITEISPYPSDSNDSYYGWGWSSGNTNASNYPFLAYIEDASELSAGDAQYTFVEEESSSGSIYLDNYFIRNDSTGKPYVYIADEAGLLRKQYIRTGRSMYGQAMEVVSGLTYDDYIAFPYGRDVKEGAQTTIVESLESS